MKHICLTILIILISLIKSNSVTNYSNQNILYSDPSEIEYFCNLENIMVMDQYEMDQLARLIFSEAGNQSDLGMLAVGNVVFNRAKIKNQNINKTIRAKGQFDGVRTKWFKQKPSKKMLQIALESKYRQVVPKEVYYFHNPKSSTDSKWLKYIEKYTFKDIGDHRFCLYNRELKKYNYKPIKRV